MEVLQKISNKNNYSKFEVNTSEELIVAISQYKTVDFTRRAIEELKKDIIPFTTLILFDGTSKEDKERISDIADISIVLNHRVNSLPHIWNMMFELAKLTSAKYLFWQGSDMVLKPGGLRSMLELAKYKGYDCVSPIKIDKDEEKYKNYISLSDEEIRCAGINDSACLFRMSALKDIVFDEMYAPYQFETSDFGYQLWRKNSTTQCIDTSAVMLHYCSKDIEHSPTERDFGSRTWDAKRDYFLKDADEQKRFFCENSIMNSKNANIYGFPVYVYES